MHPSRRTLIRGLYATVMLCVVSSAVLAVGIDVKIDIVEALKLVIQTTKDIVNGAPESRQEAVKRALPDIMTSYLMIQFENIDPEWRSRNVEMQVVLIRAYSRKGWHMQQLETLTESLNANGRSYTVNLHESWSVSKLHNFFLRQKTEAEELRKLVYQLAETVKAG